VHISPSGECAYASNLLQQELLQYTTDITGSTFNREEAIMAHVQHILPNVRFKLSTLSVTKAECDKFSSILLGAVLPKLNFLPKENLNRNPARSIIYGPQELGGIGLPNIYTVQGIDKIHLLLGHLRLNDKTVKLLSIVIDVIQLILGTSQLFLNKDRASHQWFEGGWITSVWEFASETKLTFRLP